MQYRKCFRKIKKENKFKTWITQQWRNFKEFNCKTLNNFKKLFGKIKNFICSVNYRILFNKIKALILFLIPFIISLSVFVYSLIWISMLIAHFFSYDWLFIQKIMPLKFGSIVLNSFISIVGIICFYCCIIIANQTLNKNLNSVVQFFKENLPIIIIDGIILTILIYRPWYDWLIAKMVIILLSLFGLFILSLLINVQDADDSPNIIEIILPK